MDTTMNSVEAKEESRQRGDSMVVLSADEDREEGLFFVLGRADDLGRYDDVK